MKDKRLNMNDIEAVLRPNVRLTRCQLADLFGVYYETIITNIKAIIRSGVVKPSFEGTLVQVGNILLPEYYDMEMVIALAFRLDSPAAGRIRQYVVQKMVAGTRKSAVPIFLCYGAGAAVN